MKFLQIAFGAIVMGVTYVLILGLLGYISGSLVTSGIKALSHSCGTAYRIEKLVDGEWFCPTR